MSEYRTGDRPSAISVVVALMTCETVQERVYYLKGIMIDQLEGASTPQEAVERMSSTSLYLSDVAVVLATSVDVLRSIPEFVPALDVWLRDFGNSASQEPDVGGPA